MIVVAIGGAYYVLAPPSGGVGGPQPASPTPIVSPTPRATPSPTATVALPSPSPSILASGGDIFPGTYVAAFDPSFRFTVDREVEHNCAPGFRCRGSIDVNSAGWLSLEFGLPRIELQIIRIDKVNDPAHVGRLMDPPVDLTAWIGSRPGVTVVDDQAIKLGGLDGTRLDVRTGSKDIPFGPISGVTDPGAGLGANWVARLDVIAVGGHQVLIIQHAEDGSLEELQPLVDSIVWN